MKSTDATEPDRKSGGSRGTCSAPRLPHKGLRSVSSPTELSSRLPQRTAGPDRGVVERHGLGNIVHIGVCWRRSGETLHDVVFEVSVRAVSCSSRLFDGCSAWRRCVPFMRSRHLREAPGR